MLPLFLPIRLESCCHSFPQYVRNHVATLSPNTFGIMLPLFLPIRLESCCHSFSQYVWNHVATLSPNTPWPSQLLTSIICVLGDWVLDKEHIHIWTNFTRVCSIRHYTALHHTALHTTPHYTTPHYTPHRTTPHRTTHHTALHHTALHTTPHYTTPHYATPHRTPKAVLLLATRCSMSSPTVALVAK